MDVLKIADGLDVARRDGSKNRAGEYSQIVWISALCAKRVEKGLLDSPFTGNIRQDQTVNAFVIHPGKWSAACPDCGIHATEYVNQIEKVFYCFNCGNFSLGGDGRAVVFPPGKDIQKIETLLLQRPIFLNGGVNFLHRLTLAKPMVPGLKREWLPGQTIQELEIMNKNMIPELITEVKAK